MALIGIALLETLVTVAYCLARLTVMLTSLVRSFRMCDKFSESVTKILSVIEERSLATATEPLLKPTCPTSNSPRTRPFTVLVEGNIGSGKSTYLKHFSKLSKKVDIITEPVDKWRDLNSHNLLHMMYEDPNRQVNI